MAVWGGPGAQEFYQCLSGLLGVQLEARPQSSAHPPARQACALPIGCPRPLSRSLQFPVLKTTTNQNPVSSKKVPGGQWELLVPHPARTVPTTWWAWSKCWMNKQIVPSNSMFPLLKNEKFLLFDKYRSIFFPDCIISTYEYIKFSVLASDIVVKAFVTYFMLFLFWRQQSQWQDLCTLRHTPLRDLNF